MNPRRPGSGKTQITKRTEDSEYISKIDISSSRVSSTFSDGFSAFQDKPDEFQKYVEEKDKDPKFKNLKSKLEVIQERTTKVEEVKPREKPFGKKATVEKPQKKIEEKVEKEEQDLNLSSGFAKKNQMKLNSLKRASQLKQGQEKKPEPNFDSFKINNSSKPGEKKPTKKPFKVEVKKEDRNNRTTQSKLTPKKQPQKLETVEKIGKKEESKEQKQQREREDEMKNLERYVNQVEARNMAIFPSQYERMISQSPSNVQDLQKIDLNNFLQERTEEGYELMVQNIEKFDKQLGVEDQSIDLQQIINGSESPSKDKEKPDNEDDFLDSMSASELKERNAFLTQILGGNKISKKEINELEEKDRAAIRLHNLEREKNEEKAEEDLNASQINMVKKSSQRMIEKNRVQAGGHIYRDCDYLSEQHQRRIEQLLQGGIGESPFDCDDLQKMKRRRIDEGIRMYRQMSNAEELAQIFNEESLPKDPQNRKNAQKRILTDKMKSVNDRLGQVHKVPATKQKVRQLLEQFQFTKHSQAYEEMSEQNRQRFQQNLRKLEEAQQLLTHFEQKQNITQILTDIEEQYNQLEMQIKRYAQIDAKKLKQMEKQRLQRKLKEVEEVQRQNEELESQIQRMEEIKKEVEQNLKIFDQLQEVEFPQIQCEGYAAFETLEDIDAVITKKWEENKETEVESSEVETES